MSARGSQHLAVFQHSPSRGRESELRGKMLRFRGWEGLGKCVRDHVVRRAVDEMNQAVLDYVSNEMKTYI